MATFVMFGRYSFDAVKGISAKRTNQTQALVKKYGGEVKAGYALLGDPDIVLVVELQDTGQAMQLSAALTKLLGISFKTAPAVSFEEFDKLMG
jgi:uncharacterized protein with GYD domain